MFNEATMRRWHSLILVANGLPPELSDEIKKAIEIRLPGECYVFEVFVTAWANEDEVEMNVAIQDLRSDSECTDVVRSMGHHLSAIFNVSLTTYRPHAECEIQRRLLAGSDDQVTQ